MEKIGDLECRVPVSGSEIKISGIFLVTEEIKNPLGRKRKVSHRGGDLGSRQRETTMTGKLKNEGGKIFFISEGKRFDERTQVKKIIERIHDSETTPEMAS